MRCIKWLCLYTLTLATCKLWASPNDTALAVWTNEAIVATFSYDYQHYIEQQSQIAKYFSADAWMTYTKANHEAGLPEAVQKNSYNVSAVALMPPKITSLAQGQWQAKMPLLVVYTNPQYQQKQTLEVTLKFGLAPQGQGVRGLAINQFNTVTTKEPCQCCQNGGQKTTLGSNQAP